MEKTSLLIAALLLLLNNPTASSSMTNLSSDQSALLDLKQHITSDPNILDDNWTTTTSVCNWVGVSCAGVLQQRVTALNLSDMGLTATLGTRYRQNAKDPERDQSVVDFYLPTNAQPKQRLSQTGVIPAEMGNLVNLEIFSAPSGSFTGSIPSFIFNISSLRKIDFRNNSLSGSLPVDIHYNLPLLEELDLASNQLSGHFPPGLWECRWLQRLLLSDNKFTGSISKNIGNLTMLRDLHIGDNNLTVLPILYCILEILDLILCGENVTRNEVIRKAQEKYRNTRRII